MPKDKKEPKEPQEIKEALEYLIDRRDFRYVFCMACGSEMRHSPLIICSDCLGEEVDRFVKVATEDDESDQE